MHAISPPRKKNSPEKAAYLEPKKAVYLSCQKKAAYPKQEIAANCEKYIRAKDTQVCLMIFHQNSN